MDSAPDTVRFGLIRGNCHKGDNVDLQTGAKSHVLMVSLRLLPFNVKLLRIIYVMMLARHECGYIVILSAF